MSVPSAKPKRNPSLDVLRIVAFLLVPAVHFTVLSNYSTMPVGGAMMLLMSMVRAVAVCCVPLFIMLTGYLQTNKTVSVKYYSGIIRPLVTYILASVVCLLFKIWRYGYPADILSNILRILDFTASDYGWYMEMYFGLFLLTPILNAAYHGMKGQRQKLILVGSLIALTALPAILNTFNFTIDGWWSQPSSSREYNKLIPGWWTSIYPVTYYFIGSYLREFPLKLNRWVNLFLIFGSAALVGAYNFYRQRGSAFFYADYLNNGSLFVVIVSVLIFSLISERDMTALPSPLCKILSVVSGWTLAAYLLSQIFDNLFYPVFIEALPVMSDRVKLAPVIVTAVFLCSLAAGGVTDSLYRLGDHAVKKLIHKK